MTELRVMNNPKVAAEHEEFIANLNRKVYKIILTLHQIFAKFEKKNSKILIFFRL